ncbi:hypothetical protein B4092_4891 [Bacillus licheniformis]|uniref:hypothetical protein n=1 Tax=Bacillus licheniformis TaxID=1402 RepID=UPI00077928CE|nr:hypothetical protein [Bacillus licheniformis]KYC76838.1 hypothetical protein B4092_4891 [Bacillus licheniformis]
MRHFPKWMIVIVLGFIVIGTVIFTTMQSYRYNDMTKQMKEAAQVAINKNVDKSIRVDETKLSFVETEFEKDFKSLFNKNQNFKVKSYSFDYLKSSDGFYKAIKIKVIDDQDSPYQITFVSDFLNE